MRTKANLLAKWSRARILRYVVAGLLVLSCGGLLNQPSVGGESHFLHHCVSSCADGLECIAGVCTRGCLVGETSCTGLSPSAVCTNSSVEPGAVAICDVGCQTHGDCTALGSGYRCEAGFCRDAPVPECDARAVMVTFCSGPICHDSPDPAKPGIVPPDLVSGSLADIAARMLDQPATYQSVTDPQNCAPAGGQPAELLIDSQNPSQSLFVKKLLETQSCGVAMPFGMVDKMLEVDRECLVLWAINAARASTGDPLTCEERAELASTQAQAAAEQANTCVTADDCQYVYTGTRCSHTCQPAWVSQADAEKLTLDLLAISDAVCGAVEACPPFYYPCPEVPKTDCLQGRCVPVPQSCDELERAASMQAQDSANQVIDTRCATAQDCVVASIDTRCSASCGAVVSYAGVEQLRLVLDSINQDLCSDYEALGCGPPVVPPCVPPPPLDCVQGRCVESTP